MTHQPRTLHHQASDADLVERYQRDGDTDAFTELVARHQRVLWSAALGIVRDPRDASDVVQIAWLNALRALARPGGFDHRAAVSTWLQRIVRNEAVDRLRRNRVRTHEPLDAHTDAAAPGEPYSAVDARLLVAQLLDVLSPKLRAAIELVWLRGLSVDEAAAILDVPTGTVKSRCNRARRAMADAVIRAGLITTTLHDERDDPTRT